MTLPNLLVIGAMKSGTRTFYELLRRAEGFAVTLDNEPEVLRSSPDAAAARTTYRAQFPGSDARACVRAELSTAYAKRPVIDGMAGRARDWIGDDLWVFYLVRDPIERMRSQVRHQMASGTIKQMPWSEVLEAHPYVVSFSRYVFQLEPWLEQFPDRVRIIAFDDLVAEPTRVLEAVCRVMGVDPAAAQVGHEVPVMNTAKEISRVPRWMYATTRRPVYRRWIRPLVPLGMRRRARSVVGQVMGAPVDDFEPDQFPEITSALRAEYDETLHHPSRIQF